MRPSGRRPAPRNWDQKLRLALAGGRGVRLGEAAVVSRRLHVVEYCDPARVVILTDVDFGQAAYGLAEAGQVVHIDVFHSVASVDHRAVAAAVRKVLDGLPAPPGCPPGRRLVDFFDLGTATGGGRLTSSLDRMRNPSAMAAHQNHVHLAGLLPDEDLALAWRVVCAVEEAIMAMGVQLRRIERLAHRRGGRASDDPDLGRYYGDNLDSYISQVRRPVAPVRGLYGGGLSESAPGTVSGTASPPGAGEQTHVATQRSVSGPRGDDPLLNAAGDRREATGAEYDNAARGHGEGERGEFCDVVGERGQTGPDGCFSAAGDREGVGSGERHGSPGGQGGESDDAAGSPGESAGRGFAQEAAALRDSALRRRPALLDAAATRDVVPPGDASSAGDSLRVGSVRQAPAFRGRAALPDLPVRDGTFGPPGSGGYPLPEAPHMQQALELSRQLGSPDELKRVLEDLAREQGWAALYQGGGNQAPFMLRQLEEAGLVRREVRGMRLTPEGKELLAFLRCHLRDVKLRFRKLIRRIPGRRLPTRGVRRPGRGAPSPDVRYGLVRGTAPAQPGAWLNDVAVPETIMTAIRRTWLERVGHRPGLAAAPGGGTEPEAAIRLGLDRRDIHVHLRAAEHQLHICLLIDASASMAGRRILAAKHLARHLLVSTRDRIAVIAFQERDVRVYVPFTRDYGTVEEGLSRIQPLGLTPLAHGLVRSMELIHSSRVRRPLLLLITDGIPTVPHWTADPLADALEAARLLRAARIPFGCIGLQPSRRYLEHLTREAGGTLHVVDELSAESLISIAHQERMKLAPRTR